jgi:undecaprenyl-phosphate 4-deoxy-4-formamido-L-arabinose transferase
MRATTQVSVVIPVFDEEECLPEVVERTLAACRRLRRDFELILVDDGSSDRSAELIRAAAERHPELVGVLLNRNYGQHAAVTAGMEQARGEIVVTLDADLQNPPEEIPRLVETIERGFDVVGSVRVPREDSLFRRVGSLLTNLVVRKATGVRMHDYGCMLRAYRRPVVDAMLRCGEHSRFIPVLANRFARRTTEIEVRHARRRRGDSKYGLAQLVRLQLDLLTSVTIFPLRVLAIAGALLALVGFALGIGLAVARLLLGAAWAGNGVFTLFAALFFFVGAQLVGLGLLGEYVGRIFDDVRARPRYVVHEIVGKGSQAEEGSPEAGRTGGEPDPPRRLVAARSGMELLL